MQRLRNRGFVAERRQTGEEAQVEVEVEVVVSLRHCMRGNRLMCGLEVRQGAIRKRTLKWLHRPN
jgi:hypothetical protein